MIRDDLFVAGGNTLFFYQLVPGSEPVMLVEVRIFGWPMAKLEANGSQLMVYRNNFNWFPRSRGPMNLGATMGVPWKAYPKANSLRWISK